MSDKEKLRPCPFCGTEPEWSSYHGVYRCGNCDCMVDAHTSKGYGTKEDQARWWNTRPLEDALQVQINELQAEVDGLHAEIDTQEAVEHLFPRAAITPDALINMIDALARLQKENEWRPIDDNPKPREVVNIQIKHKTFGTRIVVAGCRFANDVWYALQGLEFALLPSEWDVLSWRPLPRPQQKENE